MSPLGAIMTHARNSAAFKAESVAACPSAAADRRIGSRPLPPHPRDDILSCKQQRMVRQVSEARRPTVVTKSQLRESLPAIQSYGLAVLSVCVALGIGLLASSYGFRGVELPLYLLATAITAWYAVSGPSAVAVVLRPPCRSAKPRARDRPSPRWGVPLKPQPLSATVRLVP